MSGIPHTKDCVSRTGLQCDCAITDERERFEAWLSTGNKAGIDLFKRLENGDYFHQQVYAGWQAWKGRASLNQ